MSEKAKESPELGVLLVGVSLIGDGEGTDVGVFDFDVGVVCICRGDGVKTGLTT